MPVPGVHVGAPVGRWGGVAVDEGLEGAGPATHDVERAGTGIGDVEGDGLPRIPGLGEAGHHLDGGGGGVVQRGHAVPEVRHTAVLQPPV